MWTSREPDKAQGLGEHSWAPELHHMDPGFQKSSSGHIYIPQGKPLSYAAGINGLPIPLPQTPACFSKVRGEVQHPTMRSASGMVRK